MEEEILANLYKLIQVEKAEKFEVISSERTNWVTVVMENITKEHNASAVMRTCDCFGIQTLHLIENSRNYATQREISKGAATWITTKNYSNEKRINNCTTQLKKAGYQLIATSPHATKTIDDININQPIALLFGTERTGISDELMQEADQLIKIPMYGFTESFNVSVSVSILLNELRNKLTKSDINWKLSPEEQIKIKIDWCSKIINRGPLVVEEIRRRIIEKE